ncbi:polysaccharide biosynthesis C-terminal domain-containing protein [Fictibacillus barbaricus]|uniref:O-antigen/teichoic acid export membrane protein n=1 Tax=Fictibacillus barbaricus TaxID=182136 RepID=A0ABU1U1H9_9BACL|nr:polysaccharide biosynthesis C-terminal domain-containing protein [Fictibacillus barbaricus]MDR7073319.1 O-antigen/teichoic acid export membrane protein [Fictibacillus barbaricus]
MIKIKKQIFTLFFAGAIAQLVTFLIGVYLNRTLDLESRGLFGQLFLLFGFFCTPITSGISASILYYIPLNISNRLKSYYIIQQSNFLLLCIGLFLFFIIYFNADYISQFFGDTGLNNQLIRLFSVYPLLKLLSSHYVNILVSFNKSKSAAIFSICESLLYLLFVVGSQIFFNDIKILIIALIIQAFLVAIFVQIKLFTYKSEKKFNLIMLKKQIKYAGTLAITSSIGYWGWEIDKLFVSKLYSPTDYAIYIAGATEIPFVNTLITSTSTILIPIISVLYREGKFKEISIEWTEAIKNNAIFILPIFLFSFFYAEFIILFLYGKKFLGSILFFRIYMIVTPLRIMTYGTITQAIGRTKINFYVALAFLIINTILNFLLIDSLGPIGCSIATVISTIIMAILYLKFIKKELKIKIVQLIPFKFLLQILLISFVAILPTLAFYHLDFPPIKLLISFLTFIIMYILLCIKFKIINLKLFLSLFNKKDEREVDV